MQSLKYQRLPLIIQIALNLMRIRRRTKGQEDIAKHELYSSGEQESLSKQKTNNNTKKVSSVKETKIQQAKKQLIKKQAPQSSRSASFSNKPIKFNNNMQIKLEPSDIRFIEKIVEQKHGKILTHQEMTSLKKKMVRQNFNQSNPYNELNYNTGEKNQWRDKRKKHLSEEELKKLKKHFLKIMSMVSKGEQSKYSLRDMMAEFNLDESAFLQIKRQFESDPDVSFHLRRYANKTDPNSESSQIQHIIKKRYILEKILNKNPLLTKAELYKKIAHYTKNEKFFPENEIVRLLEQEGYSWRPVIRLPESRNFKENLERKRVFCQNINFLLTETKYNVYFLGLMNFNSFMFRREGWTRNEYLIDPTIDESFSLVALTERSGEGTWKFQKQIYKEEIFSETCNILFEQLIPTKFQPKYLVVDFRLFKYCHVLKRARQKHDIQIIWIPPFSNRLNPLEFWFEEIKGLLAKSENIVQLEEPLNLPKEKNEFLIKDIYNDLKDIFTEKYDNLFHFGNFFQMAADYHRKALEMQPF